VGGPAAGRQRVWQGRRGASGQSGVGHGLANVRRAHAGTALSWGCAECCDRGQVASGGHRSPTVVLQGHCCTPDCGTLWRWWDARIMRACNPRPADCPNGLLMCFMLRKLHQAERVASDASSLLKLTQCPWAMSSAHGAGPQQERRRAVARGPPAHLCCQHVHRHALPHAADRSAAPRVAHLFYCPSVAEY